MIKRLNEVNLKYVELVDESLHSLNERRIKALKMIAEAKGIEYIVHSPFVDINIASPNTVLRRVILKRLENPLFTLASLTPNYGFFIQA